MADESLITGESMPVTKKVYLFSRALKLTLYIPNRTTLVCYISLLKIYNIFAFICDVVISLQYLFSGFEFIQDFKV